MITKNCRKNFIFLVIFGFSVLLGASFPCELKAQTEIFTNGEDCIITIVLRKEFHLETIVSLNDWINDLNKKIAVAQEIIDRGFFGKLFWGTPTPAEINQAQADINNFNSKIAELQPVIANYAPLTAAQAQARVDGWKQQIENKWNIAGYKYDCCDVKIMCLFFVRDVNAPPKAGFDQISIMPANFRSYIDSANGWNFDANGFSNAPYNTALKGAWEADTLVDYTAPHEAGHEMGLNDRYQDLPGGGVGVTLGYEHDLMGGPPAAPGVATPNAALSALTVISVGDNGLAVDNLATILRGRNIDCPDTCCPPDIVGGVAVLPIPVPIIPGHERGERLSERPRDYESTPQPEQDQTPGPSPDVTKKADDTTQAPEGDVVKPKDEDIAKEPTGDAVKPTDEAVQYHEVKTDDVTTSTAVHYHDTPGGGMTTDVYTLPTGKGSDFRKWQVKDTKLILDGEALKPDAKENFYVDKESFFRKPATVIFGLIGTQYEQYGDSSGSGKVCPVTGKPLDSKERGPIAKGIDKAGMTAGLGLLASQAKGQLTGQKASFNLNKTNAEKLKDGKGSIKTTVENPDTHMAKTVNTPLGKVGY